MYRIVIEREDDVYMASTIGRSVAEEYGLNKSQQTKLVVSIMELSRNIVYYAGAGEVYINPIKNYGIEVTAVDKGPGISDIDKILKNEIKSKKGLGLGLSGVKRMMDEFKITSKKDVGTKVRVVKWFDERQVKHNGEFVRRT
jgi:serine/threonine-protein kinase RsbT